MAAEPGQMIDWEQIRQQIQATRDHPAQNSAQETQRVLKQRARSLSQESIQTSRGESLEVIEFLLASETYGLESGFIREVYPLKDFTPLPGSPPFVLGIVNVRGQILSVVDLKKFFHLPEKGLGQLNKLIILHNEQMEFGILADEIVGAYSIEIDSLQPAPPTVSGIGEEYLRGVTSERVILLDAGKILGDERIVVHQEAN